MTAAEIFKKVLPYPNFITPHVEMYVEKGKYVCEISTGSGFDQSDIIVGVTVIDTTTMKNVEDKGESNVFNNGNDALEWAHEYINTKI
jgi:sulfur relay (sulfurtransferase) DsrF/TusC family protein